MLLDLFSTLTRLLYYYRYHMCINYYNIMYMYFYMYVLVYMYM